MNDHGYKLGLNYSDPIKKMEVIAHSYISNWELDNLNKTAQFILSEKADNKLKVSLEQEKGFPLWASYESFYQHFLYEFPERFFGLATESR